MKKLFIFAFAGILAISAGIWIQQTDQLKSTDSPSKLIEFSFPDVTGQLRHVNEWQGKVLVINFWATWCTPCREEIPEFIHLQKQYAPQGLQFIGIAIDTQQPVQQFLNTVSINYPILIADDAGIELAYKSGNLLNTVPFTLVIDSNGNIVHRQYGEFSTESLLKTIKPLLKI